MVRKAIGCHHRLVSRSPDTVEGGSHAGGAQWLRRYPLAPGSLSLSPKAASRSAPGRKSSSGTPKEFSTHDTGLYWGRPLALQAGEALQGLRYLLAAAYSDRDHVDHGERRVEVATRLQLLDRYAGRGQSLAGDAFVAQWVEVGFHDGWQALHSAPQG